MEKDEIVEIIYSLEVDGPKVGRNDWLNLKMINFLFSSSRLPDYSSLFAFKTLIKLPPNILVISEELYPLLTKAAVIFG